MVFGLFKDGDELFEEAQDLIKQKEYGKAVKTLNKALEKDSKHADEIRLMLSFISIGDNMNASTYYLSFAEQLRKSSSGTFDFGLTSFDTVKLATECECLAACLVARGMDTSSNQALIEKGEALIKAAQQMQASVGNEILKINEHFNNTAMSGMKMALALTAEGYEAMSAGLFWDDPKAAAEKQQMAYNFRRQLGETGDHNQELIRQYTRSCKCWICGRETMGEGLHFYRMSSDISPQQIDSSDRSLDDEADSIYVCRACYTAISRRSDDISRGYYDSAINELRESEARIYDQMAYLENRINSIIFQNR